jgi:pimeloyl-ACP methyl ester carboxylesterase
VWDEVWPAFCKRFHAIRYDRRRYGRSPATTKPYYEADGLAALLRARKVTHAALVASSHGGEVALNFTLPYTANVSHLVLIGPAATGFPYSEWFLMLQRAEMQSNKVEDLIAASTCSTYLIAPGHGHKLLARTYFGGYVVNQDLSSRIGTVSAMSVQFYA